MIELPYHNISKSLEHKVNCVVFKWSDFILFLFRYLHNKNKVITRILFVHFISPIIYDVT